MTASTWFPTSAGDMRVSAIITAGGLGRRFGDGMPKQFLELAGKPVLSHSVQAFSSSSLVQEIVLVVPEDWVSYTETEIVAKSGFGKVSRVLPGGPERQKSVENGFNSLGLTPDIVAVHDGVRPFVSLEIIEEVIREAAECGGALAAVPSSDTLKRASASQFVEDTVPRESHWLAQTPQAFRREVLKKAYEKASEDGFLATDESLLVERTGARVKLVMGSPYNIKITTRDDLKLGELILREKINGSR